MELYKIVKSGKRVYIQVLTWNPQLWSGKQWAYRYVREGFYPTPYEQAADDFKTTKAAKKWISEHQPNSI